MAVSATFSADFSSFQQAVDRATLKLKDLTTGSSAVEKNLARMADSFSGRKIIQDANLAAKAIGDIENISKLTKNEQIRLNTMVTEALAKYKALGQAAPQQIRDIEKATRGAADATKGLTTGMVAVGTAIGSFAGNLVADAARKLGSALADIATQGIKLAPVVGSFEKLTSAIGVSGQEMLSLTSTATKGLITDLEVMGAANKAMLLGLPISAKEMSTLAGTAVTLGQAMGQSAAKSMDDLIVALGRGSPLILDNLGLTVEATEANKKWADSMGVSVATMTEAQKRSAFYAAAMEAANTAIDKMGGVQITLAQQLARVQVAFTNFTDALGVAVARSPGLATAMSAVADAITQAFGGESAARVKTFARFVDDVSVAAVGMAGSLVQAADFIQREWSDAERNFLNVYEVLLRIDSFSKKFSIWPDIRKESERLKKDADDVRDRIDKIGANSQGRSAVLQGMIKPIETLQQKMRDAISAVADGVTGTIPPLKQQGAAIAGNAEAAEAAAKAAKKMADALRDIAKSSIPLTADQQKQVLTWNKLGISASVMADALGVSDRAVEKFTTSIKDQEKANEAWSDSLRETQDDLRKVSDAIDKLFDRRDQQIISDAAVENLKAAKADIGFINELLDRQLDIRAQIDKDVDDAIAAGKVFAGDEATTFNDQIGQITDSFAKLAQVSGDSWGGIAQDIASGVAALNLANDAAKQIKSGTASGAIAGGIGAYAALEAATGSGSRGKRVASGAATGFTTGAALGSVVPGVGTVAVGAVGAGIGALVGLFRGPSQGEKTNDMRDAFIEAAGGLDVLNKKAQIAGVTLEKFMSARKTKDFEAAFTDLNTALERTQVTLDRYAITWADFTGPERAKRLDASVKDLIDDFGILTRAGVSNEAAVRRMEDSFVDLASQAVSTGEEIPDALAPILLQLAQMGELTDAQAEALLGLSGSGTASFEDISAAAERYGIVVDELGPKVAQLGISDAAAQIVEDYNLLIQGGAATREVLAGMADEVQNIIDRAAEFGGTVPEDMRPMLQAMIDQGELTDQAGNALKDLTGIRFAEPIEASVNRLIAKLDELIGRIATAGAALGNLPSVTAGINTQIVDPGIAFPEEQLPEFKTGTKGKLLDFGAATKVMLHGREEVRTASQVDAAAASNDALLGEMRGINANLVGLMDTLPIAIRDADRTRVASRA